jgi:hypothetical protein
MLKNRCWLLCWSFVINIKLWTNVKTVVSKVGLVYEQKSFTKPGGRLDKKNISEQKIYLSSLKQTLCYGILGNNLGK